MEAQLIVSLRTRSGRSPMRLAVAGDERLAAMVRSGSERAFAAVYERYHQQLYRYCRSIVGNDADAQDALQSAFAGAFAALNRGQRDAPLRPWLFRIAHNEAVSLLRRRRPEDELSEASERSVVSAEEQAGERARFASLLADLRELPERQRAALVMRELSGLSHSDIAIALETSVGAAKQTIFEARRSMLEFAEGREMACEEVCRAISDADGRALRARRVRAHLRDCSTCAAFAAAIPERSADLRAVAPALPAVAAAGVFGRVAGASAGHGGGGAGSLVVGAAGKTVGSAFAAKALAGVAILATATVGVTTAFRPSAPATRQPAAAHAGPASHAAAAAQAATGGSPALARHTAAQGGGHDRAIRRRGGRGAAGTSARPAGRGHGRGSSGAGDSRPAKGGARTRERAAAPAHGAANRAAAGKPLTSSGSHGAQHSEAASGSARGAGRSHRTTTGAPNTSGPGRPGTAPTGTVDASAGNGAGGTTSGGRSSGSGTTGTGAGHATRSAPQSAAPPSVPQTPSSAPSPSSSPSR